MGGRVAELLTVAKAEAAAQAGTLVAEALTQVLAKAPYARLAIPGGSAISALPFVREILGAAWSSVRLTWVDERCVDLDHAESNRGAAYRSGALSESMPPGLEMPLWLDGESAVIAEARVRNDLHRDFADGLDVTLLGLGPDGHIASLFPGHAILALPPERVVATLSDSPKPPSSRITLTQGFLTKSARNIVLAMGESKEAAIRRLLAGDERLPATHLENLTIITDQGMGAST